MKYDYIVVGAGSSGCVTASRLVRDHGARVLLLEAGKRDRHPLFKMPAGFIKLLNGSPFLTFHQTVPQPQLGGRTHELPQGHVLGGGSTINGMVYMRGRPADYEEWDLTVGGAGWRFDDLLPHFKRQEGNQRLNDAWHGTEGLLKVSDHSHICDLSRAYVETLKAMGVHHNSDFNGATHAGVGFMQLTTHRGRRCSATTAFLKPVEGDPKLTVMTECTVTGVHLDGGRAVGVDYLRRGQLQSAQATGEIILTAGALITPKLLMLSGIGPAEQLREHKLRLRQSGGPGGQPLHQALLRTDGLSGPNHWGRGADPWRDPQLLSRPAQEPWHPSPALGRPSGPTPDQPELPQPSGRLGTRDRRPALCPRSARGRAIEEHGQERTVSGPQGFLDGGSGRPLPTHGENQLASGRYLPDGTGR
jgi:hypothetical protein